MDAFIFIELWTVQKVW